MNSFTELLSPGNLAGGLFAARTSKVFIFLIYPKTKTPPYPSNRCRAKSPGSI